MKITPVTTRKCGSEPVVPSVHDLWYHCASGLTENVCFTLQWGVFPVQPQRHARQPLSVLQRSHRRLSYKLLYLFISILFSSSQMSGVVFPGRCGLLRADFPLVPCKVNVTGVRVSSCTESHMHSECGTFPYVTFLHNRCQSTSPKTLGVSKPGSS